MLQDTITLISGAAISNMTTASGTSDPGTAIAGALFYRTDTLTLRVYTGSAWANVSSAGSGSVTSVAASGGSTGLSFSGSPITTSGTLTLSGTLALANGGTGATTQSGAANAVLPSQTSQSGKFLTTDGTNASWGSVSGGVTSIAGTSNQVIASSSTGAITLSLPQSIGTSSTPTFAEVTISGTPTNSTDAATKSYVDAVAAGLSWKNAVVASTTVNLAGTYVGTPTFTLTNNSTQVALSLDGVSLSVGNRVLVKNQTTQSQNGIYVVTTVGTGSTNWVLTRASDFNEITPIDEINGAAVYVKQGTLNSNTGWTQIDNVTTFDSSNIAFAQFSGTGSGVSSLTAGTGISVSSATGAITVSNTGVTSATGTANQVTVSASTGGVTFSLPSTINVNTSGSAATLTTPRAINGVNFDGSAPITVTAAAGTLTGTTLNSTVVTSSLTSVGTITTGVWQGTAIANANLANSSVTVNGTSISLGASGTVTAAAGTLTGTTLNSTVVTSSLTSVGTITSGTWTGTAIAAANGGTGQTTYTVNDILYASSTSALSKLAIGGSGTVLTSNGASTAPSWTALSGVSVTSIAGTANQITASASTGAVTLSTPSSFVAPGSVQVTTSFQTSTTNTISAAGSTQGTATALTTDYNIVTTVAASAGVLLPAGLAGRKVTVVNRGANALSVYPATSAAIDGLAANTAVSVPVNQIFTVNAISATQWYTTDPTVVAGTGISLTNTNGVLTITNTSSGATVSTTGGTGAIQYNSAGSLASDAGFVWTVGTQTLNLGTASTAPKFTMAGGTTAGTLFSITGSAAAAAGSNSGNAGGGITLTAGIGQTNGTGASTGGAVTLIGGTVTTVGGSQTGFTAAGTGGNIVLTGGAGSAYSGNGGAVLITGGQGSSSANATGAGGNVTIAGGQATVGNNTNGSVTIQGGDGNGASTASFGGGVTIAGGGAGTNGGSGRTGGTVTITGGSGGVSGAPGAVNITAGLGVSGNTGGTITITGGTGSTTAAGGLVTLQGGTAGSTGTGGGVTIVGGTPIAGAGGAVTVQGGNGVGTNQNGSSVTIATGTTTGSGTGASILLKTGTTSSTTAATITAAGAVQIPSSPLASTVTQAFTGLANNKTSTTTSVNNTLTADAALTVTCNETGWYKVESLLITSEATSGTGGFQFDLNAGTATLANTSYVSSGVSNGVAYANATRVVTSASSFATITTSSGADWSLVSGIIQVTVAGTFGVRWAQNTTSAGNATSVFVGSYIVLTKIK